MRRFAFCLLLGVLTCPGASLADEPLGTVTIASRNFLTGRLRAGTEPVGDQLSLMEVDAIAAVIHADPLLGPRALVDIWQPPSLPKRILGLEGAAREGYMDAHRVPDTFQAEGWVALAGTGEVPREIVFYPEGPRIDLLVICGLKHPGEEAFNVCDIYITYPPDPKIMLDVALYFPAPFGELQPRFEDIANRVRGIALCLDVTQAVPTNPEAALAALLAANPTLEGCEDRLSS